METAQSVLVQAQSSFNAFYAAADSVLKPAVFNGLASLGWELVPSARPGASGGCRDYWRLRRACALAHTPHASRLTQRL